MTISMYAASVPVFAHMLGNLSVCLAKAEAHAQARGYDSAVLVSSRLAPDMLPLARQVQIACDVVKFCGSRLTGVAAPAMEDNEATIAALQDRIARTVEYIRSLPAADFDGSDAREVQVPMRGREPLRLLGESYLQNFVLPNFYFHVTTAYALLRHNGVELGKGDYLGRS